MNEIIAFKIVDQYTVWLKFSDGFETRLNLLPLIGRGISKDLLDTENFMKVKIETGGGLEWYNGFDICPNYLRELADKKSKAA